MRRFALMHCRFFTRGLKLDYPNHETSKASKKYVRAMKNLHVNSSSRIAGVMANMEKQEVIPAATGFNKQFLDLLRRIFVYDPKQRLTAKNALKHAWFKETLTDDGTEAARIRLQRERAREEIYLDDYQSGED